MSMMCWLLELSSRQVSMLRESPSLAMDVSNAAMNMAFAPESGDGSAIEGFGTLKPAIELGKSWHMLHYLFTGSPVGTEMPGAALLCGEDIGDDLGYGPARLHDHQVTIAFAGFLDSLDVAALQQRVACEEMLQMGIYGMPMGEGSDDDEDLRREIAANFPDLRNYVRHAAASGGGLMIWLC